MCEENVLVEIYNFLKNLLKTEFVNICQKIINKDIVLKLKKKKIRRKMILVTSDEVDSENLAICSNDEDDDNDVDEDDDDDN
jgi:flagellar biosynthesis/type III secretory pathway chaperone